MIDGDAPKVGLPGIVCVFDRVTTRGIRLALHLCYDNDVAVKMEKSDY